MYFCVPFRKCRLYMKTNTPEWFEFQKNRGIASLSFTSSDMSTFKVLKNNEAKSENAFQNKGEFFSPIKININIPLPSKKFNELNTFS